MAEYIGKGVYMKSQIVSTEFSLELMPGLVQSYVNEALKNAPGMDPLMITLPFLSSIGAMVLHKVSMYNYRKLWPNTWILILAPSGTGKSHAMRLGCQIALEKNERQQERLFQVDEQLQEIAKMDKRERQDNKAKQEILKQQRQSCFASDPIIPDKGTTEGYLDCLSEGQRGLIYSPEAQLFYSQFEKDFNKDLRYEILKTYDGVDPIAYKKANSTIFIKEPILSFLGGSTFEAVRKFFTSDEARIGTLARTLIYSFERRTREVFAQTSTSNKNSLNSMVDQLLLKLPTMEFTFTPEAVALYNKIGEEINIYKHGHLRVDGFLEGFKPRYLEAILSFAMILEILRMPNQNKITAETIQGAYNVVLPAMTTTETIINDYVGLSAFQLDCLALLRWIEEEFVMTGRNPITYQQIVTSDIIGGTTNEYNKVLKMLCYQEKLMPRQGENITQKFINPDDLLKPSKYQSLSFVSTRQMLKYALDEKKPSEEGKT